MNPYAIIMRLYASCQNASASLKLLHAAQYIRRTVPESEWKRDNKRGDGDGLYTAQYQQGI